jgi:hypothetical protein
LLNLEVVISVVGLNLEVSFQAGNKGLGNRSPELDVDTFLKISEI